MIHHSPKIDFSYFIYLFQYPDDFDEVTEEELKAYGIARKGIPWEQAKAPPQSVITGKDNMLDTFSCYY